jgi:hypothetical protein
MARHKGTIAFPVESRLEGEAVCDASGEPAEIALEAAPAKPPARQHITTHKSSRNGTHIDHIVVHYTTSRNIDGTISHFMSGTPRTSAHYIVGQDGVLVQMVPDQERAWHAGNSQMNARSIGIEHVAKLGDEITDAQSATSIALIRWLLHTYNMPASNRGSSAAAPGGTEAPEPAAEVLVLLLLRGAGIARARGTRQRLALLPALPGRGEPALHAARDRTLRRGVVAARRSGGDDQLLPRLGQTVPEGSRGKASPDLGADPGHLG